MRALIIASLVLCFTILTKAEVPDDPSQCKYKCTDQSKMCALKESSCIYTNASNYSCEGSYDCPSKYNCDRQTYTCVSAPLDPFTVLMCWCCCFLIFCITCPIGCYQLYKHDKKKRERQILNCIAVQLSITWT